MDRSNPGRKSPQLPSPFSSRRTVYRSYRLGRLAITTHESLIYAGRSFRSPIYCRVPRNYYLLVRETKGSWHGVVMVDGRLGWIPRGELRLTRYEVVYNLPSGGNPSYVTQLAMQYLGVRYRWGGNHPITGLDCSAFVKLIYAQLGVSLPRRARDQALKGIPITRYEDLRPGDRLYFATKGGEINHTGIYLGDGYFIHSARSRGGVAVDHLSHPLYRRTLVAARR